MTIDADNTKDARTAETVVARRSSHGYVADAYYSDPYVTIYHHDAFAWLPNVSGDSIVTDPPYDIDELPEELWSFRSIAIFGYAETLTKWLVSAGRVADEWATWWPTNAAVKASGRAKILQKHAEHIAFFGDLTAPPVVPRSIGGQRIARDRGDRATKQPIDVARCGDVWTEASPNVGFQIAKRRHPNEKAEVIMRRIVAMVPGVVVDPFCGSGTTLISSKLEGRKAIGIEKEERHCETAANRCRVGVFDFAT